MGFKNFSFLSVLIQEGVDLNMLSTSNSHMKRLLLPLLILLMVPIVTASFISIQSSIIATDNETIISVTNLGDEAAYNIQLSLDVNNKRMISNIKEQLNMQKSFEWKVPLTSMPENPGKYPLILTTNYQDANSYPFSAISVSTFDYKKGTISDIAVKTDKMNNIELSNKKTLELTIKNMAETAKDLSIRLIVPKELTTDKDKLSLSLPAKTEKTINFEIKKFSALTGSSYVVFAVIEYDENDEHYTTIANGVVKVVEKKNIFTNRNLLIALLVVLIIIFIYAQKKLFLAS
jgi:hypothetical protein